MLWPAIIMLLVAIVLLSIASYKEKSYRTQYKRLLDLAFKASEQRHAAEMMASRYIVVCYRGSNKNLFLIFSPQGFLVEAVDTIDIATEKYPNVVRLEQPLLLLTEAQYGLIHSRYVRK